MTTRRGTARGLAALAALFSACSTPPETPDAYKPTENALEAVAIVRLHVDDDTYRFPAERDASGKNVFRASFERLERLEHVHFDKYRSGYLTDVILFAKARALERIGEYTLAALHYERVAGLDSPLAVNAKSSRHVCLALADARLGSPVPEADPAEALAYFDVERQRLEKLEESVVGTHYPPVVREELERSDVARARYFAARSLLDPSLDALALQEYQALTRRHRDSKNRRRQLLALADLYAAFARRYVDRHPPVSLGFEPSIFDELSFGATRLYEVVSREDGAIEKLEATRKLEAFLAYTLQVYDEKLPR